MTKVDRDGTVGTLQSQPASAESPPLPEPSAGAEAEAGAGGSPLSGWARWLLATGAAGAAMLLALQLTAMFLGAGPENAVSRRFDPELRRWSQPWLAQNWRLFAPDPALVDLDITARVRSESGVVGPWVDLSGADNAALRHNPWPSRADQFELTRAWYGYVYRISLVGAGAPNPPQLEVLRQYLRNVLVGRLRDGGASSVRAVQARSVTTPVPTPGAAAGRARTAVLTLPWWDVPADLEVSR